jgi:lantibiotic modifying enzyme
MVLAGPAEDATEWLRLDVAGREPRGLTRLGCALYDGAVGVALFLLYLGAVTRDQRFTTLAERGLRVALRDLRREPSALAGVGAFTGWSGVLYVLSHLVSVRGTNWARAEAHSVIHRIGRLVDHDRQFDVLGGAAGAILALLSVQDAALVDDALTVAVSDARSPILSHF